MDLNSLITITGQIAILLIVVLAVICVVIAIVALILFAKRNILSEPATKAKSTLSAPAYDYKITTKKIVKNPKSIVEITGGQKPSLDRELIEELSKIDEFQDDAYQTFLSQLREAVEAQDLSQSAISRFLGFHQDYLRFRLNNYGVNGRRFTKRSIKVFGKYFNIDSELVSRAAKSLRNI